MIVCW